MWKYVDGKSLLFEDVGRSLTVQYFLVSGFSKEFNLNLECVRCVGYKNEGV